MKKPNQLYLGRRVDSHNAPTTQPLNYPLEHLTTHALLLGATGSGKTGLAMVLVEEALQQGVPTLLLDVKGDLSNLLLTFPDLAAADFDPWVDRDAAKRQGYSADEVAEITAQQWRRGLAEWEIAGEQIETLRQNVDITLVTPGSRAARPVDILANFGAPTEQDPEEAAIRAQGLASALLGLAGIDADPLQSREHILLTSLIRHAWEPLTQAGASPAAPRRLDIPTLIQMVQNPPLERVGVFDMESFYPQKERFELALTLNNLIAAPGFALWREGNALDIDAYLYAPDGRPRATIFYLAHLPEDQRRFFVTLFLEEMRSWVRQQPGTRTLRALLVFDEIFGYMPPYPKNPPTKAPLMALVKQGRAAGLGLMLATQNPADIDYKGLGNIGTWFVGTLRTERDKDRVLEGMEGAIAAAGLKSNAIETALSRLKPRIFLMHDARARDFEDTLRFFHSRQTMAYLRGPLTQAEIRHLSAHTNTYPDQAHNAQHTFSTRMRDIDAGPREEEKPDQPIPSDYLNYPPPVDPTIPQAFLPPTITAAWATRNDGLDVRLDRPARLVYHPKLLGVGFAHIFDTRTSVNLSDEQVWCITPTAENWNMNWSQGEMIALDIDDLAATPPDEGGFAALPRGMSSKSAYTKWESALKTHIYRHSEIKLWSCSPLKLISGADENKRAFLERCRQEIQKRTDADLAEEHQKFDRRMARIEDKIRREELELEQDEEVLSERKREELLSGAESVLSLFSRRRRSSRALSRTSRQRRYVKQAKADVEESVETLRIYEDQLEQLESEWEASATHIIQKWKAALDQIREISIRAKRTDIEIRFCGLAWFPYWDINVAGETRHYPAYIPLAQSIR